MGLNKVKPGSNMYQFLTDTWNIIKGKCFHDCSYCYMKQYKNQKQVRFDEKELKTDLGTGNFIFVGSSCDMFAKNIPEEWIYRIIQYMARFNNRYLLQTKNPQRLYEFSCKHGLPKNTVVCTTIESNRWYNDIMKNSPLPFQRSVGMNQIKGLDRHVTIEPIMRFDLLPMVALIKNCLLTQVNIGADSSGNKLPEPTGKEIQALIKELEKFTIVKLKKNLNRLL